MTDRKGKAIKSLEIIITILISMKFIYETDDSFEMGVKTYQTSKINSTLITLILKINGEESKFKAFLVSHNTEAKKSCKQLDCLL